MDEEQRKADGRSFRGQRVNTAAAPMGGPPVASRDELATDMCGANPVGAAIVIVAAGSRGLAGRFGRCSRSWWSRQLPAGGRLAVMGRAHLARRVMAQRVRRVPGADGLSPL